MPSEAPKPAKPGREIFDAWNSSSTGHQRAESRLSGSTSWRESRTLKLQNQFNSGTGGGQRVSDTVGAGSLDFGEDGRTAKGGWEKGAPGVRKGGQSSVLDSMEGAKIEEEVERPAKRAKIEKTAKDQPTRVVTNLFTPFRNEDGTIRETTWSSHESSPSHLLTPLDPNAYTPKAPQQDDYDQPPEVAPPMIFANLVLYVNGSCGPNISDHKLKRIWCERGGRTSIRLTRLTVTHVVIGRPNSSGGSGGGLSGSKLHKEVTKKGGPMVRFVTAEWVTESIKAGKRLPESRYAALSFAPTGVASVSDIFGQKKSIVNGDRKKDVEGDG